MSTKIFLRILLWAAISSLVILSVGLAIKELKNAADTETYYTEARVNELTARYDTMHRNNMKKLDELIRFRDSIKALDSTTFEADESYIDNNTEVIVRKYDGVNIEIRISN